MPMRCSMCGGLVEIAPHGEAEVCGPMGHFKVPLVGDKRMPQGKLLLVPPLCWECRGGVILGRPQ